MRDVSLETVGLSHREFLTLYWLSELQHGSQYPRALHKKLESEFPGKPNSYDYLCKVARNMEQDKLVTVMKESGRLYYSITPKGKERLSWYHDVYEKRLGEVKKVIDRLVSFITKSGRPSPIEHLLPEEHRTYFSKLVSVKDIVRYLALKIGLTRSFYIGEVEHELVELIGWKPSNSYLYHIAQEMEEAGLVVGKWEDDRKRTKRMLRVTDEGAHHFQQIATTTRERAVSIQSYLNYVLRFLKNN